jgi:hypothetical protein
MMVKRAGDWLSSKVGDELVMMSAKQGNYIGLSPIGARIWEIIETPCSMDALCAQLVDEYDVTIEECRSDVRAFLDDLMSHGAVALDSQEAA